MASDQTPSPISTVQALERLGSLSLRRVSMEDLLQTIADLAKTVMPGNPEAAVTLLIKDHPTTVASTGQLATDLDETQYDRGHGPCLHAARTGELTEMRDTPAEDRWPDYTGGTPAAWLQAFRTPLQGGHRLRSVCGKPGQAPPGRSIQGRSG